MQNKLTNYYQTPGTVRSAQRVPGIAQQIKAREACSATSRHHVLIFSLIERSRSLALVTTYRHQLSSPALDQGSNSSLHLLLFSL